MKLDLCNENTGNKFNSLQNFHYKILKKLNSNFLFIINFKISKHNINHLLINRMVRWTIYKFLKSLSMGEISALL